MTNKLSLAPCREDLSYAIIRMILSKYMNKYGLTEKRGAQISMMFKTNSLIQKSIRKIGEIKEQNRTGSFVQRATAAPDLLFSYGNGMNQTLPRVSSPKTLKMQPIGI